MQHKEVKLIAVFLLGLGLTGIQAQETLPATGGNASGSGGTVSYTAGQIVYTTANGGSNGSVAQGVQQPYEISVVTGIEEALDVSLLCLVYPNPTKDKLTLNVEDFSLLPMFFSLYDANGKLLENKKMEDKETTIAMSNLAPATYFLKVNRNNKEVKIFKIVKN